MEVTFPKEIWIEIFKRVDRPKLMELRLVCRYFYDIIEWMLNKSLEWQDLVDKSISFECLTLTMQRAYPYDLVTHMTGVDDPIIWRGTYLSFKKWQKVLEYEPKKDTLRFFFMCSFGSISCIANFDKYIAIAFDDGTIANYTVDNIRLPFYIAAHKSEIVQIEFWYSNGEVLVVSLGYDHTLKFWDLNNKREIATAGILANSICCGVCRHFCLGEFDGVITSYERVDNLITAGPSNNFQIVENKQVIAHAIGGKIMSALSYIDDCTIIYFYNVIKNGKLIRLQIDQPKQPDDLNATMERLIMPTITYFFWIGEDNIGSTNYNYENEWHEYCLFQRFGYHQVRCMALHAQILMVGLQDGSIHLLYIEHYGDVMDLEKKIQKSRRIEVDTVPILDLTVLEVDKKPCIVATTEKNVHLLNFF